MAIGDPTAWERKRRTPAVVAAGLAGVLQAVAFIVLLSSLRPPKHDDDLQYIQRVHEHPAGVLIAAGLQLIALGAVAYALYYLLRATRARRPEMPPISNALAIGGPLLAGVANAVLYGFQVIGSDQFVAHEPQTEASATHFLKHATDFTIGQYLLIPGTLLLAFAFVLVAINAMRVGLLTRFMGILGAIIGLFNVIPLLPPVVVAFFWFGALAVLFAGRWPGGTPPAWLSGKAEPWPSRQQMIEARSAATPPRMPPAPAPAAAAPAGPRPGARRRKRKKRR